MDDTLNVNIKKSNKLPSRNFIYKIQNRNKLILSQFTSQDFVTQQFKNYKKDLIPNLWQYAFYSGFKTETKKAYYHHFSDYSQVSVADKEK